MMWPATDLSIRAAQADALLASALQRCDEPDAGQVRRAIAAAIGASGRPGCGQRVAQEFGDHPETAVIRMRWARIMARAAFADSALEPGPRPDAYPWPGARSRLPGPLAGTVTEAAGSHPRAGLFRLLIYGLVLASSGAQFAIVPIMPTYRGPGPHAGHPRFLAWTAGAATRDSTDANAPGSGGWRPRRQFARNPAPGHPSAQLTYAGRRLYLFTGDKGPGAASGQGLTASGARWDVLGPTGKELTTSGRHLQRRRPADGHFGVLRSVCDRHLIRPHDLLRAAGLGR